MCGCLAQQWMGRPLQSPARVRPSFGCVEGRAPYCFARQHGASACGISMSRQHTDDGCKALTVHLESSHRCGTASSPVVECVGVVDGFKMATWFRSAVARWELMACLQQQHWHGASAWGISMRHQHAASAWGISTGHQHMHHGCKALTVHFGSSRCCGTASSPVECVGVACGVSVGT